MKAYIISFIYSVPIEYQFDLEQLVSEELIFKITQQLGQLCILEQFGLSGPSDWVHLTVAECRYVG